MNPDLFSQLYSMDYQIEDFPNRNSLSEIGDFPNRNSLSEIGDFPNRNSLSEIDEPVGTIAFKSDTINVTCQISYTQMKQVVADFVRVFGLKSVINAATSNLN